MTIDFKWVFSWILRGLAQLFFVFLVIFFFLQTGSFKVSYFWFFISMLAISLIFLKWRTPEDGLYKKTLVFWIVILLISFPFAMLRLTLGTNDIEPIILFFRDNGIEEARAVARGSFQLKSQLYVTFISLLLASGYYLYKKLRGFHFVLLISGLAYLVVNPVSQYIFRQIFPNQIIANFKIEEHFAKPVFTKLPEIKKNMIIVYLESLEQTYDQVEQTKKQYNKIKPFMADALTVNNVMQTSGSTFTIAGIVSTQCGVPLLARGLNNGIYHRKDAGIQIKSFYKDIECLGDRLSNDGYTLSYMNGADARKYSKSSFLSQHGYTRIFDEFSVSKDEREGRDNLWGLNDEVLYENLRKEAEFLSGEGKPFVLSYLTIATHGPDAYLDTNCEPPPEGQSKMPAAIECSFDALISFYDYMDQKGMMKDTIFVVMSDHLARKNSVGEALYTHEERRNLFFVKGVETPMKISKLASPLDIYPTLLELLGYQLKDRQANMGFSILSDQQSMIQKYDGAKEMNRRFYANHALGEFLWDNVRP
jgi:phosphoglycerol transferase